LRSDIRLNTSVSRLHAVFRIHDILVWIRIQIRRSTPLTNGFGSGFVSSGCGSGSFCFHHGPLICQQKTYLLKKFFLYITFLRYLYIIFKDKKSKRCHKTVEIKVFYYICLMKEGSGSRVGSGSGSIPMTNGSGSRRAKNMSVSR